MFVGPQNLLWDEQLGTLCEGLTKLDCLVGAEFTTRPQPKRHKSMTGGSSISTQPPYSMVIKGRINRIAALSCSRMLLSSPEVEREMSSSTGLVCRIGGRTSNLSVL
jgi:hypothetical protein